MTFTECQIKVILKEGKKMKKSLAMMLALIMVCALPGIASANGGGSINGPVLRRMPYPLSWRTLHLKKAYR